MALQKRGKWHYGESEADIRERLIAYSTTNGYVAQHFAAPVCTCGATIFNLAIDETEGAAVRRCVACELEHPIGDSEEYLEDAELEECECRCGSDHFELLVGVALYDGSEDVKWIYIGCSCPECALTEVYADWKNEFEDYRALLKQV